MAYAVPQSYSYLIGIKRIINQTAAVAVVTTTSFSNTAISNGVDVSSRGKWGTVQLNKRATAVVVEPIDVETFEIQNGCIFQLQPV